MTKVDYYLILEVRRSDPHETIKHAYRRLARKYHPDQNQDDVRAEERFKRIVEAWEILGDTDRRRMYDLFGHRSTQRGFSDFTDFTGMDLRPTDVFAQVVKQVREDLTRRFMRRRGGDLRIDVTLTLREALLGTSRVFELPRINAAGEISRRRFEIDIPRGVPEGRVLRWKRQGAPGKHGGEAGSLLVRVLIEAHPIFRFEGGELVVDLYLNPDEVRDGCTLEIPSPWGVRSFSVPSAVRADAKLEARLLGGLDEKGNRRSLWLHVHTIDASNGAQTSAVAGSETTSKGAEVSADFAAARERFDAYVQTLKAGRA